jgi:prevent-host-death family protein
MTTRPKPSKVWQLQDAKNKLSRVVEDAQRVGPQVITRRGAAAAVVLGISDYERLVRREGSLCDFLLSSPLRRSGLELSRSRDMGREIDL